MHKEEQTESAEIALKSEAFREAMRRFATTVSIVSCASEGCHYEMSAIAITSLSFDPPSLLVCVNKSTATHRALSRGGRFCVNVLRSFHSELSRAFSGKLKGEDRFRLGNWRETEDGLPFLSDTQANLFCEIACIMDYATHTIFIGRVYSVRTQADVDPLLYRDGEYAIAQPVSDEQAGRGMNCVSAARSGCHRKEPETREELMHVQNGTSIINHAGAARNRGMTRRKLITRGGAAAAATALFSSFPAPWVRAAKPVKIGYVSPQTGPLAPFAEADNFIVGAARELFKKQNVPIEIIVKDSQTNSNRAAEVAADLILKDKVSLMVVGAAPETDNPVADQCELNEVPCVSTVSPWQPWFFARGGKPDKPFKWTYHYFWGLEDAIGIILDMWSQPQLQTNRVVGAAFANDPDANAWGDSEHGLPPALAKNGYKLIHPPHFQTLTDNFSAQISAFKEAGAEIITGNMIPPDFTTFWTQARQQGLRPKICTITKALLFPSSVESVGQTANNLSTEVWWSPTFPFKSSVSGQSAAELAAAYTKATGKQWTQPIGFVHSLFEVAADIIKRSADAQDPAANLDALIKTNLQTIVGPITWDKGPVKNVAKTPLVSGQWRLASGGPFKYDLIIVANGLAPQIPLGGKMEPLT